VSGGVDPTRETAHHDDPLGSKGLGQLPCSSEPLPRSVPGTHDRHAWPGRQHIDITPQVQALRRITPFDVAQFAQELRGRSLKR
jgi:hypothetical protein